MFGDFSRENAGKFYENYRRFVLRSSQGRVGTKVRNKLERYRRVGETTFGSSRPPYHQHYIHACLLAFFFSGQKVLRKILRRTFGQILSDPPRSFLAETLEWFSTKVFLVVPWKTPATVRIDD